MIDWAPLEEEKRETVPVEAIAHPVTIAPTAKPEPEPPTAPPIDFDLMQKVDSIFATTPPETLARLSRPMPDVQIGLETLEKGLVSPQETKPKPAVKTVEGQKVHIWPSPTPPEAIAEPTVSFKPEQLAKAEEPKLEPIPSHTPKPPMPMARAHEYSAPDARPLSYWETFKSYLADNIRKNLPSEIREIAAPDITHGKYYEQVFDLLDKFEKQYPTLTQKTAFREATIDLLKAIPDEKFSIHDKKLAVLKLTDPDLYKTVLELQKAPSDMAFARLAQKGAIEPLAEQAWPSLSLLLSEKGREALKEASTLETAGVLAGAALEIASTLAWARGLIPGMTAALGPALGIPAGVAATAGAQTATGYLLEKGLQALGAVPSKEEVKKALEEGREPPTTPEWLKVPMLGLGIIGGGAVTLNALKAITPRMVKDIVSHVANSPAIRHLRELNNAVHSNAGKEVVWTLPRIQAEADIYASYFFEQLHKYVKPLNKEQRKVLPQFMDLVGQNKTDEALEILQKMSPSEQLKFAEAVEAVRVMNMEIARAAESVGLLVKTPQGEIKPFKVQDLPEKFREGWYAPRIVRPTLWSALKKDLAAFTSELTDILEREAVKDVEQNVQATLKAYQNFIRKHRPHQATIRAVDYLMKERQLTPGQAMWHLAQNFIESKDEIFFSPNLQRHRTIPIRIPGLHLDDIVDIYDRYLKNSSLVIHGIRWFGPRGERLKETLDRIDDPIERQLLTKAVWYFARGHLADERLPVWYEKIWSWYVPAQVATKIGFGTANIANWFQPFISFFVNAGIVNSAKGLYKLMTDASFRDLVKSTGVTINYDVAALLSGIGKGGKIQSLAEVPLKWNTFTGANRFWQVWSAATAYHFLQDLGRMMVGKDPMHFVPGIGVKRQEFAKNYLYKLGVDPGKIGKDGSIPLDELKVGMYNFANRAQLQKAVAYEPLLINNPWVRPFTLFKRFGIKQWQMIYNDVLKYALINPMPVIRLALLAPLAGEAAFLAKELYRGLMEWVLGGRSPDERLEDFWKNEKYKSELQRLAEYIANVGMLGIVSDWFAPRKVVGKKQPETTPETIAGAMIAAASPVQAQTVTNINLLLTDLVRHNFWPYWPEAIGKAIAREMPLVRAGLKEVTKR